MKDAIKYRQWVREALAAKAGFALTEEMLVDAVQAKMPRGLFELSDMRAAVEWNIAEGYVKSRKNEDIDEREWLITPAGLAKEEL